MTAPDAWLDPQRFPRAAAYHPGWVAGAVSGGANALVLTEWLSQALDLRPGQRVLDLGCGRGASSVFLRREFGVQVWSVDLWFSPDERLARARDAGVDEVYPLRCDARHLPFARDFFDAVVSIDSFVYYGTDDLFLLDLARFLKPGGQLGIAGAGLVAELDGPVPDHLAAWWEPALACLHSAAWWRRHWERSGVVAVEEASTMPDGWREWLAWQRLVSPDNTAEIAAVEADAGATLGYVRAVARRTAAALDDPITAIPTEYSPHPLLGQNAGHGIAGP